MTTALTPIQNGAEMVAIVPARSLSWHQVRLPAGTLSKGLLNNPNTPHVRAVLVGLMEDQLLDYPEQLHFALQPQPRADAPAWVAVCDKQWLTLQLQGLQQKGINPQRLVPEWAPNIPGEKDETVLTPTLWMTGTEDDAHLGWTDTDGVHLVPVKAGGATAANPSLSQMPSALYKSAVLMAEPAVAQLAEQVMRREAKVMTTAQRLQQAAKSSWNLAQFDLSLSHSFPTRITHALQNFVKAPEWRSARWAALVLAVVQVIGLNAMAWRSQADLDQLKSSVRAMLTATFPGITVVVDAPLQMQREINTLRAASGAVSNNDLEALLAGFGAHANTALPSFKPTTLDYAAGELRLTGPGLDPNQLPTLNASLQTAGLSGTGLNARAEGTALVVQPRSVP